MSATSEENEDPSSSTLVRENESSDSETLDKWDCLAAIPLRIVYSLLPRTEQGSMSKVCQRWFDEFEIPSNWTTLRFIFPTNTFTLPYLPSVKFALRYGRFIKDVEISCRERCQLSFAKVIKQFEVFVKAIRDRSHLESVTIFNLKQIFSHIGKKYRFRVITGICRLFRTQKNIKSVTFNLCTMNRKETDMIFMQMFIKSRSPITKLQTRRMQRRLKLRNYFFQVRGFNWGRNHEWIINMLQRLEEWETDYCKILECVVNGIFDVSEGELMLLGRGTRGTLKLLTIKHENWTVRGLEGIPSTSWQALRTFCPELKVHFTIGPTLSPRASLAFLLPAQIPLRALTFRISGRKHNSKDFKITEVFERLTNTHLIETLEDFTILWDTDSSPAVPDDLDNFIRTCPLLKSLEVQFTHPLFLRNLFLSWTKSRPALLEEALFIVTKIPSSEEYNRMNSLAQHFIPTLKLMGINFTLNLMRSPN